MSKKQGHYAISHVRMFYPEVKTVTDGKRSLRVEVTPTNSANALRKRHQSCAFAQACSEVVDIDGIVVARSICFLVKGTRALRYIISTKLSHAIRTFDKGGDFPPGMYQLNRPTKGRKLGELGHSKRDGSKGKHGAHKPRKLDFDVRAALASGIRLAG